MNVVARVSKMTLNKVFALRTTSFVFPNTVFTTSAKGSKNARFRSEEDEPQPEPNIPIGPPPLGSPPMPEPMPPAEYAPRSDTMPPPPSNSWSMMLRMYSLKRYSLVLFIAIKYDAVVGYLFPS